MIHGLDSCFLVAAAGTEHAEHTGARGTLARLLSAGDLIAIAPQVLAEFIHIVTDPRRFTQPLDMPAARQPGRALVASRAAAASVGRVVMASSPCEVVTLAACRGRACPAQSVDTSSGSA